VSGAPLPEDLVDLVEGGVSAFVGTRDAAMCPEIVRSTGALVSTDRKRITVFLPEATSKRTVANVRDNGEVAVGFSRPFDNLSIQIKGRSVDLHLAGDPERATPERYHAAYVEQLYMVGLPRSLTTRINTWPAWALTIEVRDVFVQTPGPGAGKRL
jgi:hypothetical protein